MSQYYFETLPLHPRPEQLESLTSYIIRLAEINSIELLSLSDFIRQTFNINRKSIDCNRVTVLKDYCPSSFGILPMAAYCSEVLLRQTTFYHLELKFGRPMAPNLLARSLAPSLRYCPLCLFDHKNGNRSLLWRFLALKGCYKHSCRLLDQCTHCGQKIPLFVAPLRIRICPTCKEDLSACHIVSISPQERDDIFTLSSDLNFLLSPHPLEDMSTNMPEYLGQQFLKKRLEKQLKAIDVYMHMGMTPAALESMETGRPRGNNIHVSFLSYMRYAKYLGVTWRELFHEITYSLNEVPIIRPQYRRAWPDEKDVLQQVHKAIECLHKANKSVTLGAISKETNMAKAYLRRYPLVNVLLEEISDEAYTRHREEQVRQDHELFRAAHDAALRLEYLGEIVSVRTLVKELGVSRSRLECNPFIKDLLVKSSARSRSAKRQREQEELAASVLFTIEDLDVSGQLVSKAAIANQLDVKTAFLDKKLHTTKLIDRSVMKIKRRQQREEELVRQVGNAIEQLHTNGKPVSYQSIEEIVGITRRNLRSYPRVKVLIEQSLCLSSLKRSKSQKKHEESELIDKLTDAIDNLNMANQPITLSAICKAIGISLYTLKEYPTVSSLLDQCIDGRYQSMKKQSLIHEENVRERVVQAICQLEVSGKIVTVAAIAEILGMDTSSLTYYSSIRIFLQQYELSSSRYLQREEQLIARAKAIIRQLEASGAPFSLETLCRMLGCSRKNLKGYPRVEGLLKQCIEDNRALRSQQKLQKVEEEEDGIKKAIQQLAVNGQPITVRAVSKIIGKPPKGLYTSPHIVALINKEIKEKTRESKLRQKQIREDVLIKQVFEAKKQLQILKIPFSGCALAKQANISYSTLQSYPRVRAILQQFRQENSQVNL